MFVSATSRPARRHRNNAPYRRGVAHLPNRPKGCPVNDRCRVPILLTSSSSEVGAEEGVLEVSGRRRRLFVLVPVGVDHREPLLVFQLIGCPVWPYALLPRN